MIYLPRKTTKFLLILLSATILFHIVLIESERFKVRGDASLSNATKSQYQALIDKADWLLHTEIVNKTEVDYFFGMITEEAFYVIYTIYFLIVVGLIIIIRTSPKQSNDKQTHSSQPEK